MFEKTIAKTRAAAIRVAGIEEHAKGLDHDTPVEDRPKHLFIAGFYYIIARAIEIEAGAVKVDDERAIMSLSQINTVIDKMPEYYENGDLNTAIKEILVELDDAVQTYMKKKAA